MQNLIRMREPWEQNLAQDDEAIPKLEPQRSIALNQEIDRLIPLVNEYLDAAGIDTEVVLKELDERLENSRVVRRHVNRSCDLFEGYFEFDTRDDTFRFQMHALERGVGVYAELRERAFREMFNPLTWLAWLVSMPILILHRAGVPMDDASSKGVHAVAWVLRMGMLILITFVVTRLGFSIPWEKIGGFLK